MKDVNSRLPATEFSFDEGPSPGVIVPENTASTMANRRECTCSLDSPMCPVCLEVGDAGHPQETNSHKRRHTGDSSRLMNACMRENIVSWQNLKDKPKRKRCLSASFVDCSPSISENKNEETVNKPRQVKQRRRRSYSESAMDLVDESKVDNLEPLSLLKEFNSRDIVFSEVILGRNVVIVEGSDQFQRDGSNVTWPALPPDELLITPERQLHGITHGVSNPSDIPERLSIAQQPLSAEPSPPTRIDLIDDRPLGGDDIQQLFEFVGPFPAGNNRLELREDLRPSASDVFFIEETLHFHDAYGDNENTDLGCLIKKIRVNNPLQLERLIEDYGSGVLLNNWKMWFKKRQPQITQSKISLEILDNKHHYLQQFLGAETLDRRIVFTYCDTDGPKWYWAVAGTDSWHPTGEFVVRTGEFEGYRIQDQDVDTMNKIMTYKVESLPAFKRRNCPMCSRKEDHPAVIERIKAPLNRIEICIRWDDTEHLLTMQEDKPGQPRETTDPDSDEPKAIKSDAVTKDVLETVTRLSAADSQQEGLATLLRNNEPGQLDLSPSKHEFNLKNLLMPLSGVCTHDLLHNARKELYGTDYHVCKLAKNSECLLALDRVSHVPKHSSFTIEFEMHIRQFTERLIKSTLKSGNFLIEKNEDFRLRPIGSFSSDTKVGDIDEFDYLLLLTCPDKETYERDGFGKWIRNTPLLCEESTSTFHSSFRHILQQEFQFSPTELSTLTVSNMYVHGPAHCIELKWHCCHSHEHSVSIDITPAVTGRDRRVRDDIDNTFRTRAWPGPMTDITGSISSIDCIYSEREWSLSSCQYDAKLFSSLDEVSPSIKSVYRCLKTIRDNLLPKTIVRNQKLCTAGSYMTNTVSSYALKNILFEETSDSRPLGRGKHSKKTSRTSTMYKNSLYWIIGRRIKRRFYWCYV